MRGLKLLLTENQWNFRNGLGVLSRGLSHHQVLAQIIIITNTHSVVLMAIAKKSPRDMAGLHTSQLKRPVHLRSIFFSLLFCYCS